MAVKKKKKEEFENVKKTQGLVTPKTPAEMTADMKRAQRRKTREERKIDITTTAGGMSRTDFGVQPPPEGSKAEANLRAGRGIELAPTQEELKAILALPREEQIAIAKQLLGERQGKSFDVGMQTGEFRDLSFQDVQRIAQERGIIQPGEGQGIIGRLQEKVTNLPSLAPESGTFFPTKEERQAYEQQQRDFIKKVFAGTVSAEELKREAKNFAIGLGITGGIIGAALALPHVASFAAGKVATVSTLGAGGSVSVLGKSVGGLGTLVGALFLGRGALDFRGEEMDTYRRRVNKVVEDGERIEAMVRNGAPASQAIIILSQMEKEISLAEQRIKELGIANIQYRVSKEYIVDQAEIRTARLAVLRRILAVRNIAATGQAQVNPEALMFNISQF